MNQKIMYKFRALYWWLIDFHVQWCVLIPDVYMPNKCYASHLATSSRYTSDVIEGSGCSETRLFHHVWSCLTFQKLESSGRLSESKQKSIACSRSSVFMHLDKSYRERKRQYPKHICGHIEHKTLTNIYKICCKLLLLYSRIHERGNKYCHFQEINTAEIY